MWSSSDEVFDRVFEHFEKVEKRIKQAPATKELMYDIEYKPTEIEQRIIASVEKTHPQLSPLVIFLLSAAKHQFPIGFTPPEGYHGVGLGLIVVMVTGGGKSVSQEAVEHLVENPIESDALTPAGIEKMDMAKEFENKKTTIIFDDLATLIFSSVGPETFKLLSQLVFKGSYKGITKWQCTINNAEVCVLFSTTPSMITWLMKSPFWTGQSKDRFLRIHYFYNNKRKTRGSFFPPKVPDWVKDLKGNPVWKVSTEYFNKCVEMLSKQLTPNRAKLFTVKLLTGHAILCQKGAVDNEDAKWLLHYTPFIIIEPLVTLRWLDRRDFTAGPPIFCNIIPELLFSIMEYGSISWDKLREQSYLFPVSLNNVLTRMKKSKLIGVNPETGNIEPQGLFKDMVAKTHKNLTFVSEAVSSTLAKEQKEVEEFKQLAAPVTVKASVEDAQRRSIKFMKRFLKEHPDCSLIKLEGVVGLDIGHYYVTSKTVVAKPTGKKICVQVEDERGLLTEFDRILAKALTIMFHPEKITTLEGGDNE